MDSLEPHFQTTIHYYWLLSSSIGRPKHVRVMAGALEGDTFIGPKTEVRTSLLSESANIFIVLMLYDQLCCRKCFWAGIFKRNLSYTSEKM